MNGSTTGRRHRVVIVGCGFGGLSAAKALQRADVDVTVIDRTNHHLGRGRAQRVITAQQVFARHALEEHGARAVLRCAYHSRLAVNAQGAEYCGAGSWDRKGVGMLPVLRRSARSRTRRV